MKKLIGLGFMTLMMGQGMSLPKRIHPKMSKRTVKLLALEVGVGVVGGIVWRNTHQASLARPSVTIFGPGTPLVGPPK